MTVTARKTATAHRAAWETGRVIADDGSVHMLQGDATVCGEGADGEATVDALTCRICVNRRRFHSLELRPNP
jgi:hypothetical protein